MAHKKLRLEVELETAKAKRQVKGLASDATERVPPATPATSASADRAARQIRELGDAAQGTKVNMKEVTRAFAGMAVGMAANYAAKSMKPGAARDAVEYGGAAVTGASMGMIAGPIGAAIGALGGVLKTYLDREGTKRQANEDFMRGEHDYASARAFKRTIENLTEVGDAFENLQANIDETRRQLEHYRQVEQDLIGKVKQFRENGNEEYAKLEEGYLGQNRSRQEALEGVLKNLEKQQKANEAKNVAPRESVGGTDALAKIGAGAAGSAADSSENGREPDGTGGTRSVASAAGKMPAPHVERASRPSGFFGFSVPAHKVSTMTFGNPKGDDTDFAIKVATEAAARLDEEMAKTLKEIAANTKGGDTWR